MNSELKQRCDRLVENKNAISAAFKWENNAMNVMAAYLLLGMDNVVDVEALKNAETILKEKKSIKGYIKVPILCKMILSGEPEQYLEKVQKTYGALKDGKWFDSEYKFLAAMTICETAGEQKTHVFVERTKELYQRMRENHSWLTSDSDTPLAAVLAVSEKDVGSLVTDMEKCFSLLKDQQYGQDALQSLTHVLALVDLPAEEKCEKLKAIYAQLKAKKHKYGTGAHLASLGMLTLLDMPAEQIADEIIEIDEYLKEEKGLGDFMLGSQLRRMYAAQLVLDTYMPSVKNAKNIALGNTLVYAMELAAVSTMCVVIAAT